MFPPSIHLKFGPGYFWRSFVDELVSMADWWTDVFERTDFGNPLAFLEVKFFRFRESSNKHKTYDPGTRFRFRFFVSGRWERKWFKPFSILPPAVPAWKVSTWRAGQKEVSFPATAAGLALLARVKVERRRYVAKACFKTCQGFSIWCSTMETQKYCLRKLSFPDF